MTLRVWVRGKILARAYDASLLALTRNDQGLLMLTFVANRQTHVVPFADVLKVEVVQ